METTQTFTLCGWWDYDEVTPAHHVFISESRLNEIFAQTGVTPPGSDGITGSWLLDVMLGSTLAAQSWREGRISTRLVCWGLPLQMGVGYAVEVSILIQPRVSTPSPLGVYHAP